MRLNSKFISFFFITFLLCSCNGKLRDSGREVVAEVYGNFLYMDDLQQIIPPDLHRSDSTELADKYIQKWATDLLMYEKAKQNISDMSEIDRLVNEYRKTLTIHQYQQRLVEQTPSKEPDEDAILEFYETYRPQMVMKENMIQGLLLVVPEDVPNINEVRQWVIKADQESIENIDKYSLQNAISYDYFMDTWIPFSTITRKTPFQIQSPTKFLSTNNLAETSDSTHHYFLKISSYAIVGQTEPYDLAKEKISNILSMKNNTQLISDLENELYKDAVANRTVKIYK